MVFAPSPIHRPSYYHYCKLSSPYLSSSCLTNPISHWVQVQSPFDPFPYPPPFCVCRPPLGLTLCIKTQTHHRNPSRTRQTLHKCHQENWKLLICTLKQKDPCLLQYFILLSCTASSYMPTHAAVIETDKGDILIWKEKPSQYGMYKEHPY
jgi:hypothetical protein